MLHLSPVTTSEVKAAQAQSCSVNWGLVLLTLWETKPSLTIPTAGSGNCLMQVTELTLSANTKRDLKTPKLETEYIIQPHLPYQLIPSILVLHCRGFRTWELSEEFCLQSPAQTLQIKSPHFPGVWIVGLICTGKVTKFYWPNKKRHLNFQATARKANAAHRVVVRSWNYLIPIPQYPWVIWQKTKLFDVTPAAFVL